MTTPIGKVRGEGNCSRVTDCGEEACECMGKGRVCYSPLGYIHTKSARRRTETSSQAGPARRVSTTSRSRFQKTDQVNDALVRRKRMLLSGEVCQTACEPSLAPASKHLRLKGWNGGKQFTSGEAELSRGHNTDPSSPTKTGRTEQ